MMNGINKKNRIWKNEWKNFGMSLISGVMTGIAFSWDKAWWIVFFSLIPFCEVLFKEEKWKNCIFGFTLGNYMISISWLYALLPALPDQRTGVFLLFLAIFLISILLGILFLIAFLPFTYLRTKSSIDIFLVALFYILGEWFQEKISIISFPWVRLAVTVTPWKAFIQSASVGGSLFVSFLTVLINGILAWDWHQRGEEKKKIHLEVGKWVAVILVIGNIVFGYSRLFIGENSDRKGADVGGVILIQGNHSGMQKWNMTTEEIFKDYLALSIQGLEKEENIKLILWPETAVPIVLKEESKEVELLTQICQKYQTEFLIGGIYQKGEKQYNAMFAIGEKGLFKEIYTKQILVPFGEYLPYDWLLEKIMPNWVEEWKKELVLKPGEKVEMIPTSEGVAGGIICYESIFSETARNAVKRGAEFFALISNDSWFGSSAALKQHHAQAILRAVEQKREVMRVSNTGISSFISKYGIVEKTAPILERMWLTGEIEKEEEKTVYFVLGDVIAWGGVIVWGIGIYGGMCWRKGHKNSMNTLSDALSLRSRRNGH